MKFFLSFEPDIPTLTHQNGIKPHVVNGHASMHKTPELRRYEGELIAKLARFRPDAPMDKVCLSTMWYFNRGRHRPGWKTTKPDTDNLVKTLKDCMTVVGFWKDDSSVVLEHIGKKWAQDGEPHGIFVDATEMK